VQIYVDAHGDVEVPMGHATSSVFFRCELPKEHNTEVQMVGPLAASPKEENKGNQDAYPPAVAERLCGSGLHRLTDPYPRDGQRRHGNSASHTSANFWVMVVVVDSLLGLEAASRTSMILGTETCRQARSFSRLDLVVRSCRWDGQAVALVVGDLRESLLVPARGRIVH
jgi:hypothetical protein